VKLVARLAEQQAALPAGNSSLRWMLNIAKIILLFRMSLSTIPEQKYDFVLAPIVLMEADAYADSRGPIAPID